MFFRTRGLQAKPESVLIAVCFRQPRLAVRWLAQFSGKFAEFATTRCRAESVRAEQQRQGSSLNSSYLVIRFLCHGLVRSGLGFEPERYRRCRGCSMQL